MNSQVQMLHCITHNSEIVYLDLSDNSQKRLLCGQCLINLKGQQNIMSLKEAYTLIQRKKEQSTYQYQQVVNQAAEIIKTVEENSFNLYQRAQQISKQLFKDKDQKINSFFETQQQNNILNEITYLINHCKGIDQITSQDEIKRIEIDKQKYISLINDLQQAVNTFQITTQNQISQFIISKCSEQYQKNSISTTLISQTKQESQCNSIAFNYNSNIMAVQSSKTIKLYNINSKDLELIKILVGHEEEITCLLFSKNKDWLMSADRGKIATIRLWKNDENIWSSNSVGKNHSDQINCLLLNQNEDILLSGSDDQKIIVWKINYQKNNIEYNYSLKEHSQSVRSLSLSNSGNYFISIGFDNKILVWQNQQNYQFKLHQSIQIEEMGTRITFIDENKFLWLSSEKGICKIFQKSLNGKYLLDHSQTIQLEDNQYDMSYYFPCYYNYPLQIILLKHNYHLYFIKIVSQDKCQVKNLLEFKTNDFYGGCSQNGEYLGIWNYENKFLQLYSINYQ